MFSDEEEIMPPKVTQAFTPDEIAGMMDKVNLDKNIPAADEKTRRSATPPTSGKGCAKN